MTNQFIRTEIIFGSAGMEKLFKARVAIFGIGGVGGYTVEALARSGIGQLDLFDADRICLSNINRQIYATRNTLGMYKVDVAKDRIREINPDAIVKANRIFFMPDTSAQIDFTQYDYIIDAIDTVSGKIELVLKAYEHDIPIISSMGAGNKVNPAGFQVADIYDTSVCPLARVMRHELRKRGINKLKVVYSREPAITVVPLQNEPKISTKPNQPSQNFRSELKWNDCAPHTEALEACRIEEQTDDSQGIVLKKHPPGSNAFVPPVVGMILAGEVVKHLTGWTC